MNALRTYLARLANAQDPTADLRYAAYATVIAASIIWLSVDMAIKETGGGHRGIDAQWDTAFGLLLATVSIVKMKKQEPTP